MTDHPARCGWRAAAAVALALTAGACTASGDNGQQATVEGTRHVCSSCHGPNGRSVSPTFPRLAGQQNDYLVAQLKAFRDHTRADPHAHTYMWGMAARLNDATIAGLASFYSGQEPTHGTAQDPAEIADGKKIFDEGVPDQEVPACMACHGDKAQGNGAIPRLAGQHRAYLEEQLAAFSSNERANPIMHETSRHLTPAEIDKVASFLAAQ